MKITLLKDIPDIDLDAVDLLRTVGVKNLEQLADQIPADLSEEIEMADKMLNLPIEKPSIETLSQWIDHAKKSLGLRSEPEEVEPPRRSEPVAAEEALLELAKIQLDTKKMRTVPTKSGMSYEEEQELVRAKNEERVRLIREPLEATNRGKDPRSRRYIRGVLHGDPWQLRFAALSTLLLVIVAPFSIVSGLLLMMRRKHSEMVDWVPDWTVWIAISLPVMGMLYIYFCLVCLTGKCKVCKANLFTKKRISSNAKAHRITGLGLVIPLCLHALLFSWFRCSACGTPIRLKK